MRAALGALLLRHPDYLLLDEPTNHLDLDGVGWLESFLADSSSALIVVSHDRTFLNRLVATVAEVDNGRVRSWAGNYDRYRVQKAEARELARKKAAQEAHRVGEIERFVERFRYKATKARQVQSRIKMLEKMERTEVMGEDFSWRFNFPAVTRSGQRVALLAGVRKAYGANRVLKGVDLEIHRGDRIALVGPNGCGKSTLLQVLAGRLMADEGSLEMGEKVVLHYFAQHVLESLTPGRTVAGGDAGLGAVEDGGPAPLAPGNLPVLRGRGLQAGGGPQRRREEPAGAGPADAGSRGTSSCWTSPPTTWTFPPGRRWRMPWRDSGGRSCSSPTTGTSSTRWRPAWRRSRTEGWSCTGVGTTTT